MRLKPMKRQAQATTRVPPSYHVMLKPRGPICNLACEYCYFLSKEQMYPDSEFTMPDEVLESFTRQYIRSQSGGEVTFAWQGGEPTLMGLEFFRRAVRAQKDHTAPGIQIENTLQTNGILLDDEWCAFLKENDFLVGISIDGPPDLHDLYRRDKGGQPTAEKVLGGLKRLQAHGVDYNILCTVHAGNAGRPLDIYRYFRDELNAAFIQFIPIVELDNKTGYQVGNKVTARSVTGRQYGDFLVAIFDEWLKADVGRVFVQIFDVALAKWMGLSGGLCIFEETCGFGLALEHNGDLFSCDHYVEPRHRLGNIIHTEMIDLVASENQIKFGQHKADSLPRYCLECDVRFVCNGGCPKDRIRQAPDGEYGLNYLCEGYKTFFHHIDGPMRRMVQLLRS